KDEVRTMEDFAGSVPDDLIGWTERKDGEATRHPGSLDGFDLTRADAEAMIMAARLHAGWVTEEDLQPSEDTEEAVDGEEAEADDEEATAPASD
ncbi:MAG: transcription termination factor NusA, partial [Alphaproteobacteria bacterium]